jgi:hypothetical protein
MALFTCSYQIFDKEINFLTSYDIFIIVSHIKSNFLINVTWILDLVSKYHAGVQQKNNRKWFMTPNHLTSPLNIPTS